MAPVAASYRNAQVADEMIQATTLLRQLMEEISAKPFEDPTDRSLTLGPESGEGDRSQYDNVDDYNGLADSTAALTLLDGTTLNWSGGLYERSVSVEYRASPSATVASSGDFAVVTVTVTTPHGQAISAQRLVCRYPRGG